MQEEVFVVGDSTFRQLLFSFIISFVIVKYRLGWVIIFSSQTNYFLIKKSAKLALMTHSITGLPHLGRPWFISASFWRNSLWPLYQLSSLVAKIWKSSKTSRPIRIEMSGWCLPRWFSRWYFWFWRILCYFSMPPFRFSIYRLKTGK